MQLHRRLATAVRFADASPGEGGGAVIGGRLGATAGRGGAVVLRFNRDFAFRYETAEELRPGVERIVARNPKDYTWVGTNTHLVGRERVAIIDPGPASREHVEAVLGALAGRPVTGIFVTHSHLDHAPAAAALKEATGAPVFGFGPIDAQLAPRTDEEVDLATRPDIALADGAVIEVDQGFVLEAVHTPGHFPNHLCYALTIHDRDAGPARLLFSGDHVMGWSTTVIVPPLGNLEHYLDSLVRLLRRPEELYLPSHGPAVADARGWVRALIAHRHGRERQIVACLARGIRAPEEIVAAIYEGLTPRLQKAAAGSVRAHLDFLAARGLIDSTGRLQAGAAEIDAVWPYRSVEARAGGA